MKKVVLRLAVPGLFCLLALSVKHVRAQDFLDPWDPPHNLSQSSATSNPSMVIDPTGRIHVIWYLLDNADALGVSVCNRARHRGTPVARAIVNNNYLA
jgi:hypothetical protein